MLTRLFLCGEKIWVLSSATSVLQYWDDPPNAPWPRPPPPSPLSLPLYTVLSCFTARYNPTGCLTIFQQASCWLFWTTDFAFVSFFLLCFSAGNLLYGFFASRALFRPAHFFHTKEYRRFSQRPIPLRPFCINSFFHLKNQLDHFEHTLLVLFTSWRFLEWVK